MIWDGRGGCGRGEEVLRESNGTIGRICIGRRALLLCL